MTLMSHNHTVDVRNIWIPTQRILLRRVKMMRVIIESKHSNLMTSVHTGHKDFQSWINTDEILVLTDELFVVIASTTGLPYIHLRT
jgi:hypothetical protein